MTTQTHKKSKTLLFVYNADSGIFNTMSDIAHKMLSPSTYECNLCAITHSYFSVRETWTDFLKTLDVELNFLHRDELTKQYGKQDSSLPAIFFINEDNSLDVAIDSVQINQCKTIEDLQAAIRNTLA